MAIVAMQKVAVIARLTMREELIEELQRAGVLQVSGATGAVSPDHTETNFRVAELAFAIETLEGVATKETQAAMRKHTSDDRILAASTRTDVRGIVDTLHSLEKDDTRIAAALHETTERLRLLRPWTGLDMRLDAPSESTFVRRLLGSVPDTTLAAFQETLARELPRSAIDTAGAAGTQASLVGTVHKEDISRFEELATAHGWTTVTLPLLAGTPADLVREAELTERELHAALDANRARRIALSAELPDLHRVRTFMGWLTGKQATREAMMHTFATTMLLGWIPKTDIAPLERRLHALSPAIAIVRVKPDEGEEPPVFLKNSLFFTPFESVTNLYGLPLPHEMDPTAPLSLFFALFFALCLTDAGYGLALTAIVGTFLWAKKLTIREATLPWLLLIGGIASILVGIPFGGWFGLTPDQVPAFLTKTMPDGSLWFRAQVWNLSTQDGITFLQNLSLVLGVTHLFFGMFLAGWHKWIHGQRLAAFWEHFTSHILLGAVLFYVFAPQSLTLAAQITLGVAAVLLVWGKGNGSAWYLRPVMGLLGVMNLAIGLLSNGLSYLRILALGLVTGAMALAVNQVAIEMGKLFPWWLGIPVVILIAVIGHTVSITLNTLGSFIHAGRLQFIEFFGQFFEGGGRPFMPFARSRTSE